MTIEATDEEIATEAPMQASITASFHYERSARGRKRMMAGPIPPPAAQRTVGRIPRLSRLMALAIRFESLIRDGAVSRQSELAEVGHVTRARVTQIMNLLLLAPDIQEEILFLPPVTEGKETIREHHLRRLVGIVEWDKQRSEWRAIARRGGSAATNSLPA